MAIEHFFKRGDKGILNFLIQEGTPHGEGTDFSYYELVLRKGPKEGALVVQYYTSEMSKKDGACLVTYHDLVTTIRGVYTNGKMIKYHLNTGIYVTDEEIEPYEETN